MSYFVIEVRGKGGAESVDALNQAHTEMMADLAGVDERSTGTFGIDQVNDSFSSTATGTATGDHLEAVKGAFAKIKAAFAGVDPDVDAKYTYVDDKGTTVTHVADEEAAAETSAPE